MVYVKTLLRAACVFLLCVSLFSCGGGETAVTEAPAAVEDSSSLAAEAPTLETVEIAARGKKSEFQIVYGVEDEAAGYYAARILEAFKDRLDVTLLFRTDYLEKQETPCEILVGATRRSDCAALTETLGQNEYAIKTVREDGRVKVVIAYKGVYALMSAVNRFMEEYIHEDKGIAEMPIGAELRGSCSRREAMTVSSIPQLRDPCILVVDGVYYAYGTGWVCWKNTSGDLATGWKSLGMVAQVPPHADTNYWAPEVHFYNGAYYMFTTYHSTETGHRGCTIMKSDSPEGPFAEITDGHITPRDWDAIDGTLYVDPDGQPWMIFVHEWTSTDDGVGRMAAARLSADLTHFVSEPVELFRADDPSWAKNKVTDGCWMYRCADGQLLMLWSNWDSAGYCVGIARSADGRVDGEWTQDKKLLYSKSMTGEYDGGHGMLFTDTDGQMYLSIHSPNSSSAGRKETPVFIPVREENGTLIWDIGRN